MSLPVDTDLRQAKSYLKTGKVAEAQALYEKVLLTFPKSKRASEGLRQVLAIPVSYTHLTLPTIYSV